MDECRTSDIFCAIELLMLAGFYFAIEWRHETSHMDVSFSLRNGRTNLRQLARTLK
jgi:hypothetical protein